jgi:hypothetical protein
MPAASRSLSNALQNLQILLANLKYCKSKWKKCGSKNPALKSSRIYEHLLFKKNPGEKPFLRKRKCLNFKNNIYAEKTGQNNTQKANIFTSVNSS